MFLIKCLARFLSGSTCCWVKSCLHWIFLIWLILHCQSLHGVIGKLSWRNCATMRTVREITVCIKQYTYVQINLTATWTIQCCNIWLTNAPVWFHYRVINIFMTLNYPLAVYVSLSHCHFVWTYDLCLVFWTMGNEAVPGVSKLH